VPASIPGNHRRGELYTPKSHKRENVKQCKELAARHHIHAPVPLVCWPAAVDYPLSGERATARRAE
jgi:hypothetical protein